MTHVMIFVMQSFMTSVFRDQSHVVCCRRHANSWNKLSIGVGFNKRRFLSQRLYSLLWQRCSCFHFALFAF